ncbi:MAG: prolyl oligopeptidase family serine peptidase [Flavobacteriaceae bacterium]|nr:prolyl oligopeptidase family serine peptidase [Flavobacteriaceae bacterium]
MKKISFLSMLILIMACNEKKAVRLNYPVTKKADSTTTFFGETVADPYRWLEDDLSNETAAWVDAQNKVTFGYLDQIPYRNTIAQKLEKIWNYERISAPFEEGDYTYFTKNDGLQNQSVVYRKKGESEAEVFLDPNTFSTDGTTSLAGLSFSKSGKLAAYSISEGGSDWRKVIVINAETKEIIEDTLTDIKFSGLSWRGEEGFYYSSYDRPDGSQLSAKTDQHKLYFHKIGTPQTTDMLVYGDKPEQKRRYVGGSVSEDGRFLFINAAISTAGNELYLMDLTKANAAIVPVIQGFDYETSPLDVSGSTLYLFTNHNAPNKRVVQVDVSTPGVENWQDFISETAHVLGVSKGGGYFFAEYMKDAISQVFQYDYQGNRLREIELPGVGSAGGFGGKRDAKTLYYSFTNYITPGTTFAFNPKNGTSEVYQKPNVAFDSDAYTSKQVFYTSKDGTRVPMIITHKKDLVLDGTNPTILYGYGGFNVSLTPSFSIVNAVWMEMGGVYAVPNLRGGGEYGRKWHDAGTKMQKQNVFDDFIAAAAYLIDNQYTSPDYLAIRGGSNGGLLVGATMAQRPELFAVALPAVGVMDMLRYHTFTAGAGWAYDYGTAEDSEEMFAYLKGYSPLHNLKEGVAYPATLVTTADHDDRVVPAHSFKFAATLQQAQAGEAPTLIRIEKNAGHGAGKPVSKSIAEQADVFAFTLYNMGIKTLE